MLSDFKKSTSAPIPVRIHTISDILKNLYSYPNSCDIQSALNLFKKKRLGYEKTIIRSDPIRSVFISNDATRIWCRGYLTSKAPMNLLAANS